MPNTTIQLKKSSTPSAKPADLANGELAINFADGKLYYKNTTSSIVEITPTQSSDFGTVSANGTLLVADTTGDVLTITPGNNISIVGSAINDTITIGLKNNPTFIGNTTVSGGGKFIAGAVGGDEGGEILLEKPPSGNLSGGITIDAYQDRIRIFEQGGAARGVYINLALAAAGVATDLLNPSSTPDTTARTIASAAYDKANSANILAFNTGVGANAFASATIAGANSFFTATIAGANTAVGTGANNFMIAVQNGSNTAVGTGANAFTSATIAGANSAVGAGANAFASATIAGANSFFTATIAGANSAVGTGANNFMIAVQNGSNTAVGSGANAFAVATFGAANTRPVGNTLSSTYTVRSTRRSLNFIPGSNITINVDDDSAGDRSNVTIAATGGLTAFAAKTSNYTAVNGDRLLCNTTAGTFIVTLPATPTSGATVLIYDIGNFTANPLTVARNASTIEFIADDFSLDIGQTRNEFVYDGSTWHVYSSIGPRGLADTTTVASSIAYSIALG